jgi:hypothetical protein
MKEIDYKKKIEKIHLDTCEMKISTQEGYDLLFKLSLKIARDYKKIAIAEQKCMEAFMHNLKFNS